jgi:hypothetical protein
MRVKIPMMCILRQAQDDSWSCHAEAFRQAQYKLLVEACDRLILRQDDNAICQLLVN